MPFDDDLNEAFSVPAMPVHNFKSTHIGSKAQPMTFIGLLPSRRATDFANRVRDEMRENMRDILTIPLTIHLQGTDRFKTAGISDMSALVSLPTLASSPIQAINSL